MIVRPSLPVENGACDVSEDALLGGRIRVRQPHRGERIAIDPILLAAAVPARRGERVLDAGAGTGAAALCLARRVAGVRVTGLERVTALVGLARTNAALNRLASRVAMRAGDIAEPPAAIALGGFDHVMANPPHLETRRAQPSPVAGRRAARMEDNVTLDEWVRFCLATVRRRGSVTLIHRADRLDAILGALSAHSAGEVVVFPLWPKQGRPAKRVIVRARKGVATALRLAPGLTLHEADGRFTAAAEAVLREAAPLEL